MTNDYRFLAFVCLVVVFNNLLILWRAIAPHQHVAVAVGSILLWGAVLGWTVGVERLTLWHLGFRREGLRKSAGYGLLVGFGMAVPAVLFLAFPLILSQPVRSTALSVSGRGVLPVALPFVVLVNTAAIFEELLFRGLIQERGVRWLGPAGGIGLCCGLFVLWHVVVTYQGIQQTNLRAALLPLPVLYIAAAVPLAVAGAIFSLLRYRTNNLAGSIVAHWLVNSLLQGFLLVVSARAAGA